MPSARETDWIPPVSDPLPLALRGVSRCATYYAHDNAERVCARIAAHEIRDCHVHDGGRTASRRAGRGRRAARLRVALLPRPHAHPRVEPGDLSLARRASAG